MVDDSGTARSIDLTRDSTADLSVDLSVDSSNNASTASTAPLPHELPQSLGMVAQLWSNPRGPIDLEIVPPAALSEAAFEAAGHEAGSESGVRRPWSDRLTHIGSAVTPPPFR